MTEQNEHPVDLLPELALGVLTEAEAADLRVHLAGCASCQAEHDELQRVARLLPFAAEDREPSPATKAAVMYRIATEPRSLPARSNVVRPRWPMFGAAAAAGVLLLAVGGFGGWLVGSDDTSDLEDQLERQQVVVNAAARLLIWQVARGSGAGSKAL